MRQILPGSRVLVGLMKEVAPYLNILNQDGASHDLSAVAGTSITYFTVPAGKRWNVLWLYRGATIAGTYVGISDGTWTMPVTDTATAEYQSQTQGLYLKEGQIIIMKTTGNVADTAVACLILYEEQDAYEVPT